ncbi:MAG: EF-hand domain-containing protein [Alphaproteobacteria bacterium]|nr:EF-hand domain-containing protein [Alphaproteobacteria bacterium]
MNLSGRTFRLLAVIAAALPLLVAPAFAQQSPPPRRPIQPPSWFTEIDAANTGVITRAQFIAHRMKTFDQLDTDKDGVLSRLEFMKLAEPPFSPHSPDPATLVRRRAFYDQEFAAIDTNDDGKVTRAEFETSVALNFRESDIDGDGRITREEVMLLERTAQDAADKARRERCRIDPDCNGDGFIDLEEFIEFETARLLERLDFDRDGKVSLQTFLQLAGPATNMPGQPTYQQRREQVLQRFNEIDTNKDGMIDAAEIRAWATALFKRIDLDGDGKINRSEWQLAGASQANPPTPPPVPPTKLPATTTTPQKTPPATTGPRIKPVPPPPPPQQTLQPGAPLK